MELIKEYGGTVLAAGIGALIGGYALGVILKIGDDKDIEFLKWAHDGYGG